MSLNEEKYEEHPNQLAMPREIQDELVNVIHTSLNNIAVQLNNLNKYAEDLLGELSEEVDRTSFRLKALQKRVIPLTNGISHKGPNEELSLETPISNKTIQSKTIQRQQAYSSKPLSLKMFETHEASVQTSLLNMPTPYCQDDTKSLKIFPDTSYCFEIRKEGITRQSKEQNGKKLKQKKQLTDYPNEPEGESQCHLTEVDVLVNHISAACGEASHSYVDQPAINSSFSTFQFSEISKLITRAVGKVLSSPLHLPMHGAGDLKNSLTYVSYGTGVGEVLQPQPRQRPKTEVFVSPTAPNSPPPLPPDWVSLLRASRKANPSPMIHFPSQLPSPVLRTPAATSPPDCLQDTAEAALPLTPPKEDFSPPVPEPFQYYELTPDNLFSHGKDQEMPPPLSPLVASPNQLKTIVTPPRPSIFQSVKSSFTQSPRPLAAKSPRSSIQSKSVSSLPTPSRFSVSPLPSSSIAQTSQSSFPQSPTSSCPQTSSSLITSPRHSVAQVPKCSVAASSRCVDAYSSKYSVGQLSRSSVAQSSASSVAQSRRSSVAQSTASSLKSSKSFTPQSLFSFVQSPSSCISSPWVLSVSQSSPSSVSPGLNQSPSTVPIITKARSVLMETIRKGILPNKTKDQCVPKVKIEIPKNEVNCIPINCKAMGYSFSKEDSEVDWMEENKQINKSK